MSDSPYINWFTSDFLTGVAGANMNAEQIGVYAIILNLIGDSCGPIDDDAAWLARRCNISTRKMSMILDELASMPNKIVRKNGLIGNKRMLAEVRRRDKRSQNAKDAANERWNRYRAENKPQLPFEDPADKPGIKRKKSSKNNKTDNANAYATQNHANGELSPDYRPSRDEFIGEIKPGINSQNRENSAENVMRTHPDSCARVNPDPDSIQTNDQNLLDGSARENLDRSIDESNIEPPPAAEPVPTLRDKDLAELVDLCTNAAGFYPRTPGAIAREFDLVKTWRDLGMDFEAVVIPTIKLGIEGSVDPTSSLLRFDRKVRFAHAQHGSKADRGPAPLPPPIRLDFPSEDASLRQFRADLAEAIGHNHYARLMNRAGLEIARTGNGSKPLRIVRSPADPFRLLDGDRTAKANAVALKHGFTAIWE